MAWTTRNGSVLYAKYASGSWSAVHETPAITDTNLAPALAAYNGSLFMAWVDAGSSQLLYSRVSLSGGSWSEAETIGNAGTAEASAAPALGILSEPGSKQDGLYVAWIDAGQVSYLNYNVESGYWIPGPIPPGPAGDGLYSGFGHPSYSMRTRLNRLDKSVCDFLHRSQHGYLLAKQTDFRQMLRSASM